MELLHRIVEILNQGMDQVELRAMMCVIFPAVFVAMLIAVMLERKDKDE